MRRILIAAVLPLLLLAACGTPGGLGPPVQIIRVEVSESTQLAATALETAWQGYLASGAKVAPDVKAKVDMALGAFQTLANTLSASPGTVTLQQVANDVLAACNAIMADLPPGTLPPNVVAAITAGEIVAHAVLTVVEQQSSAPKWPVDRCALGRGLPVCSGSPLCASAHRPDRTGTNRDDDRVFATPDDFN